MREELKGTRQLCISSVVLQVTEAIEFLEAGHFWYPTRIIESSLNN